MVRCAGQMSPGRRVAVRRPRPPNAMRVCKVPNGTTGEDAMVAAVVARPEAEGAGGVDPITAEVIRSAMETVCFEMATFVSRTATTPILNQSNERNATILDAEGRLAALSVGIPQFMLSSTLPVRF